jgi:hypothetical protein
MHNLLQPHRAPARVLQDPQDCSDIYVSMKRSLPHAGRFLSTKAYEGTVVYIRVSFGLKEVPVLDLTSGLGSVAENPENQAIRRAESGTGPLRARLILLVQVRSAS